MDATGEVGTLTERELYGPRGWSVRAGVWEVLAPFTMPRYVPWTAWEGAGEPPDEPGAAEAPAAVVAGAPTRDHVSWAGLDGAAAAELLDRLPSAQLLDRQNDAPELAAMLGAAAEHPGLVEVHGYGIGPQRCDERVTAEGLVVYAFADVVVSPHHGPGCRCGELWGLVGDVLGLDGELPDELHRIRPPWAPHREGWWLWWD
ncbi:hypothetical protein [Georgenia ruanii]|uniref:hypothetical protein n=1 Tax=Georgenia ruanii TaxID=348442 RepID=UPI001263E8BD|nr:hypothetical protein [Georgenia ruanii]